jgi:arginyl-tRNA synthetase
MMARTTADLLTALIDQASQGAGLSDCPVSLETCVATKDPSHGDYQSNFAFRIGKALGQNPREVAAKVVNALPEHEAVAGVEVAGPGFINFRLTEAWLAAELVTRASSERFGTPQVGAGKTMVIDYSSPNIAKRMHIAHLRSTVIGNAIHRLYAYLGWRVIADNHIGDWGTPFGKLIVAWRGWRDDVAYEADALGELQRLYQSFKGRSDEDPSLEDKAREETAKLQSGEPDNIALWEQFVEVSLCEFNRIYDRLGVSFDVVHGESYYRDQLHELVEELKRAGLAVVDDGAVVVPFPEGSRLEKSPMLVQKRDGASLYATTDMATVRDRVRQWNPDRIIYVTDLRQKLHFRQLFEASRMWGYTEPDYVHVPFGILRFPDGALASSRSGDVIRLAEVLDVAVQRARALVDGKSDQLSEETRAEVAEAVGVAAVRYFDLSQNPQSDITFDWDRSLALDGNTAPYLMYAYARCRSILRRAEDFTPNTILLREPAERQLAMMALRTPEVIQLAADTHRPNLLCDHLYSLTQAFSRFWEQCRVWSEDHGMDITHSRLTLTWAVACALEQGFEILGIQKVERL